MIIMTTKVKNRMIIEHLSAQLTIAFYNVQIFSSALTQPVDFILFYIRNSFDV